MRPGLSEAEADRSMRLRSQIARRSPNSIRYKEEQTMAQTMKKHLS